MADTMKFDLVSPERRVASGMAKSVRIPGSDGDMTIFADHAPTITSLRPGVVVVETDAGTQEFVVVGGFAEITPEGASVLAEEILPRQEVTQDFLQERIRRATQARDEASMDAADMAAKFLADLVAMGDEIQIPTTSRVPAPA
jgi:F-type H+-transporting ATPase subunit epsilon